MSSPIPRTGSRGTLDAEVQSFLKDNPALHLGGGGDFHEERQHHTKIFSIQSLPESKWAPICEVEFTGIRGPHGFIPLRLLYPSSGQSDRKSNESAALVYMHGGGYTVGTVDEFEQGLRVVAEESGAVVVGVEYRLAPEWRFPTQLDEYSAVIDWLQGQAGKDRGISPDRICGGGDSAGGNMTAALALRRLDEGKKNLKAQILLYPEARLPFDTPAATENNSGLYLECNGIFSFADHYLPRGTTPQHRYVSPGMQEAEKLKNLPPAAVFTSGFDPLRDVGVEYAGKLREAGNQVEWHHFDDMTHGWLQMTPWSSKAQKCTKAVGVALKELCNA